MLLQGNRTIHGSTPRQRRPGSKLASFEHILQEAQITYGHEHHHHTMVQGMAAHSHRRMPCAAHDISYARRHLPQMPSGLSVEGCTSLEGARAPFLGLGLKRRLTKKLLDRSRETRETACLQRSGHRHKERSGAASQGHTPSLLSAHDCTHVQVHANLASNAAPRTTL